jgi:hypothetical protein
LTSESRSAPRAADCGTMVWYGMVPLLPPTGPQRR